MANSVKLIVFPVKDVTASKQFFTTFLHAEPYVDGEWYVGYHVGDLEIGLDPNGKAVVSYTDTDNIKARLQELTSAGATVVMEPKDVGGGLLVAQVEFDGNTLGLRQPAEQQQA